MYGQGKYVEGTGRRLLTYDRTGSVPRYCRSRSGHGNGISREFRIAIGLYECGDC